jgi:AcrR family transcriptional regulator
MDRQARRDQLLDAATAIILGRGVVECGFEQVAAAAGVSKALLYKHFADREDLLRAIVEREYDILRGRGVDRPQRTSVSLEEAIRIGNLHAFQYLHDRGPILRVIFADPAMAERFGGQDREERGDMTGYYARRIARTYAVPEELAFMGTLLTINAAFGAARALKRYEADPKQAAEFWTTFILGGWAAASARYGARQPETSLPIAQNDDEET